MFDDFVGLITTAVAVAITASILNDSKGYVG